MEISSLRKIFRCKNCENSFLYKKTFTQIFRAKKGNGKFLTPENKAGADVSYIYMTINDQIVKRAIKQTY
jgi:hypothetical protein